MELLALKATVENPTEYALTPVVTDVENMTPALAEFGPVTVDTTMALNVALALIARERSAAVVAEVVPTVQSTPFVSAVPLIVTMAADEPPANDVTVAIDRLN